MRLRLDGRTHSGRVVDLRDALPDVGLARVRRALCLDPDDPLAVVTDSPPSLHRALARAARTRGHDAPQDDRIATLERRLAERTPPDAPDLAAARRRAADAAADVERLRERVATARGRLQATRETGGDTTTRERAHQESARKLARAETDHVAAVQALTAASERASERRTARQRTLRLRDELANRQSDARRVLADQVYHEFSAALERLPGRAESGTAPSEFAGDAVTGHLGAVAIADRDAPVVLAVPRFGDPTEAATRLDVPVVQL